jgi:Holliday junction resolvasome RuvABC DNA-binding subunit
VRREFPAARLVLRAYDRIHALQLAPGATEHVVRETFSGALELGAAGLEALGFPADETAEALATVRRLDAERLAAQTAQLRGDTDRTGVVNAIAPEPLTKGGRTK